MGGIENNPQQNLRLGRKGEKIDLKAFKGGDIVKNDINKSIFNKFDFNNNGKLDSEEAKALQLFIESHSGDDGKLSKREVKRMKLFGKSRQDVKNFYGALNDLYDQQLKSDANAAKIAQEQAETELPVSNSDEIADNVEEETVQEQQNQEPQQDVPQQQSVPENKTHQYKVNYQDTWYGIVQAKYGITNHKQTMEIVRQLKDQNNVSRSATNMPKEITLPENIQLKDGTEIKLTDLDAEVDKSHFGYKTESKTGRYTITQNGTTKYYAADGTELKQSYFEAVEADPKDRKMSENGSGRSSYTASNGETWYFAADGKAIKKEYYERRETEYNAVKTQQETAKNARQAFQQQVDSDGWAGKTADAVSVLWNSDNRAVKVDADLKNYENQIKLLQKAQGQGAAQFNAQFKGIFGVNYDPAAVAEYEANPTDENYKKAYGTKNDIHKRVMDYNKSQQDGAKAVKTTVVVAGTAAAAIATGGSSLIATAAVAGASTAGTRMIVETTDLATNNIDGDVNAENLNNISKQAAVEGTIAAVTAGVFKGGGNIFGKMGTASAGATSKGSGMVVKSTAEKVSSKATSKALEAATNTGKASGSSSASSAVNSTIGKLSQAETKQICDILGKSVDELSSMSQRELKKLIGINLHPDKAFKHNLSGEIGEKYMKECFNFFGL